MKNLLQEGSFLQNGTYQIERTLSSNEYGRIFLANQIRMKRKVCIQEFDPETQAQNGKTGDVMAFMNRSARNSELHHNNLAMTFDVFEENNCAYSVTEYIDGDTLESIVVKNGKLKEKESIKYILEIADALQYIHSEGLLHLDISPESIIIEKGSGRAVLNNYGSVVMNSTQGLKKNNPYQSIEMMQKNSQEQTRQTDIYALGATLYRILTGTIPDNAMKIFMSGMKDMGDSISEKTKAAIKRAMSPQIQNRTPEMKTFMKELGYVEKELIIRRPKKRRKRTETIEIKQKVQSQRKVTRHQPEAGYDLQPIDENFYLLKTKSDEGDPCIVLWSVYDEWITGGFDDCLYDDESHTVYAINTIAKTAVGFRYDEGNYLVVSSGKWSRRNDNVYSEFTVDTPGPQEEQQEMTHGIFIQGKGTDSVYVLSANKKDSKPNDMICDTIGILGFMIGTISAIPVLLNYDLSKTLVITIFLLSGGILGGAGYFITKQIIKYR